MSCVNLLSGPPSPPRLGKVIIFREDRGVFVLISWTESEIDGTAITRFKPSCKAKRDIEWLDGVAVDHQLYGYALCAVVGKPNQTQTLRVVARVLAINPFGSTSSELLDLRISLPHWTVHSRSDATVVPFVIFLSTPSGMPNVSASFRTKPC